MSLSKVRNVRYRHYSKEKRIYGVAANESDFRGLPNRQARAEHGKSYNPEESHRAAHCQ
jgi:hypothetical protein